MGELSFLGEVPGRKVTKPQKNAGATTGVTAEDLASDDDVVALTALRNRAAEMLARPSILERDFKAVSVELRAVREALKAAKLEAQARELGKGKGSGSGPRGLDDDI